jgi:hypothetical protein
MGLGPDKEISKTEFVETMRARLEVMQPGLGTNVDNPDVNQNLGVLGEAVFRIATVRADVISSSVSDSLFWHWVMDVNTWLTNLRTWQKGIMTAVTDWTPTTLPEQNLKAAITALSNPGEPPAFAPAQMKGKII